jgi:hypothetical protein
MFLSYVKMKKASERMIHIEEVLRNLMEVNTKIGKSIFNYSSQEVTSVITKIMKERRRILPERGDYIFSNGSGVSYFWDGQKAILPGGPVFCIPSEFKIPKEFPITYWDECRMIFGHSLFGDFCYDTSEIKKPIERENIFNILVDEGIYGDIAGIISEYLDFSLKEVYDDPNFSAVIFKDNETDFHIVLSYDKGKDGKERALSRFMETGRCYRFCTIFQDRDCDELSSIEKIRDYIDVNGDFSRCIYVNEYTNRMRVDE